MSRNTHDRYLDHHGLDAVSNIELKEFLGPYEPGTSLTTIITDLLARLVSFENQHGIWSFPVSAVIFRSQSGSFTASAVVLKTTSVTFTVSAEISS